MIRSMRPTSGSPFRWLGLSVLLLTAYVFAQPLPLQPGAQGNPADRPYNLPTRDPQLTRRHKNALQLNDQGRALEAIRQLQNLLAANEDSFVSSEVTSENPARKTHRAQIRGDLEKLIQSHAGEYEAQYGGEARRLLTEALARQDWPALAEVAQLFQYTQAGLEATSRLAHHHLDHGRFASAALLWQEWLRVSRLQQKLTPNSVALAAYCWERAGNPSRVRNLLQENEVAFKAGTLEWGGRSLPLPASTEQIYAWIHVPQSPATRLPGEDWLVFRGETGRTPVSAAGPPGLREQWQISTTRWKDSLGPDPSLEEDLDYLDRLDRTFQNAVKRNIPLLPSMSPLIVGDLAIIRTYRHLQGVDLKTGQIRWESGERDTPIDYLLSQISPAVQQAGNRGEQLYALLRHRTWDNLAYGTLSSDGERVYSIEDSGFYGELAFNNNPGNPLGPRESNRLVAHDVKTGRMVWDVGNRSSDANSRVGDLFFLGPPLPLEGRLYCLADDKEEVQLVVLNAADGKMLWSQTLVQAQAVPLYDALRRFSGLSPTAVDGLIVCPTGLQTLVAVNPTTQSLAWAYEFKENSRGARAGSRGLRLYVRGQGVSGQSRWSEGEPMISGDSVLITPRETQELFCLNLYTGELRWKAPRDEALYVAGVVQGKVILVGRNRVRALGLSDGKPLWPEEIPITPPAGRGFFSGAFYFLPLANQELLTLDLEQGSIRARRHWWGEKPLGNLVATERGILSQSYDTVYALPSLEHLAADQHITLKTEPRDEPGWLIRGEVRLHQGDFAGAFADFHKAWDAGKNTGVRDLWVSSALEEARVHPQTGSAWLAEIPPAAALDSPWGGLWTLARSADLSRQGKPQLALDLIVQALQQPQEQSIERHDTNYAVRRDLLFASALSPLFDEKIPAADREQLTKRLEVAWQESKDRAELRNDLLHLTRGIPVGERFRDTLLSSTEKQSLGGEMILLSRAAGNDPKTAAPAVAQLAAIALDRKETESAESWGAQLQTKYSAVQAAGGRTGRELLSEWAKGNGPLRMPALSPWPTGKVVVKQDPQAERNAQFPLMIAPLSEPFPTRLPYRLQVDQADITTVVNAVDSSGRELWSLPLMDLMNLSGIMSWRYAAVGHLVLVSNRQVLWAIDTLQSPPRIVWRESLYEGQTSGYFDREDTETLFAWPRRAQSRIVDSYAGRAGGRLILANQEIVCVLKDNQILGLDPLTGKNLWKRFHVGGQSEAFSEGKNLCLVDLANPAQVEMIRQQDGASIGSRSLPIGEQVIAPCAGMLLRKPGPQNVPAVQSRRTEESLGTDLCRPSQYRHHGE
ncbi:MAG: PQQ-binding-like beta-propeller repeat protein [Planctomycetales bacterium]